MNRKLIFLFAILYISIMSPANAQSVDSVYYFDKEIVVTASKIPTEFLKVSRTITVIDQSTIRSLPISNIADLLEIAAGVDVRKRGSFEIQADISLRGATFEQTLILLDGIKLYDPQTGHHNLDLPVSLHDIEKIEILKGPGSKLYGPNAFGGVINIITKKPSKKSGYFSQSLGSYDFYEAAASLDRLQNRFSFYHAQSSGYQKNTDFRIWRGFYKTSLQAKKVTFDFSAGYVNKKFGANNFYSPNFPLQWENTATAYASSVSRVKIFSSNAAIKLHWRRHYDHFFLDRHNPDIFQNYHVTDVIGINLQTDHISPWGITSLGLESNIEKIRSDNLGNHQRFSHGIYFEHQKFFENVTLDFGMAGYQYSDWGWRFWPGFDMSYLATSKIKLYGSINRAFRIPTYTDLYYSSPQNIGNANLREENCWNYEIGMGLLSSVKNLNFSIFKRDSKNLIDWQWVSKDQIWKAENIRNLNTYGAELDFKWTINRGSEKICFERFDFSYSYLKNLKPSTDTSKYVINHLRHNLKLRAAVSLFAKKVLLSMALSYQDRIGFGDVFLCDANFLWKIANWKISLEANNLFNRRYREHYYIVLPGRWIKMGFILQR